MYEERYKLKSWASDIDEATLQQASKAARLPIVHSHVALMPDAHLGIGATVGSVIPTIGAVIPSAVGVDIGCVDFETEYLSQYGWRRISEWKGEKVAQYDIESGWAEYVTPLNYIEREQEEFLYLHTKYGIDQMLTPDHKMVVWELKGRDRHSELRVLSAQEFCDSHSRLKQGYKAQFKTTFIPNFGYEGLVYRGKKISETELRVQVAVNADGWMDGNVAQLKFRKERKIERFRRLIDASGITYTTREYEGDISFRFIPPMPKGYNIAYWRCNLAQLQIIADEVMFWDGNKEDSVFYTRDKQSADFIHFCFAACGYRSVMRQDERGEAIDYRVFANENTMVSMGGTPKTNIDVVPSKDGKAYCFTVASGFLVLRRNGNIFITGNCGMAALRTNMVLSDLPDSLEPLLSAIGAAVPAGVGQGHSEVSRAAERWLVTYPSPSKLTDRQTKAAHTQLGTLGSGNHFWELCQDTNQAIWVLLHSGSRGIGNQLAQQHISKAKQLAKSLSLRLEDPDLAYFTDKQYEFQEYIQDMLWAQEYARENRELMLDASLKVLQQFMGKFKIHIEDRVNCHHNFTQQEVHVDPDGIAQTLWITRKGAIKANINDRGLIPGSMGTRSYVVRGKGNADSWNSCSHGAGRRHSRSQAKKIFTTEDLNTAMSGKVWLSNKPEALLDEIPMAYKDIDQVMADQQDLVEVEHILSQLVNYKGA